MKKTAADVVNQDGGKHDEKIVDASPCIEKQACQKEKTVF